MNNIIRIYLLLFILLKINIHVNCINHRYARYPRVKTFNRLFNQNMKRELSEGLEPKNIDVAQDDGGCADKQDQDNVPQACKQEEAQEDDNKKCPMPPVPANIINDIAQTAAKEAEAARVNQTAASQIASDIIKKEFAEKAMKAAKVAETELKAKKEMVKTLERQIKEAEQVILDLCVAIQQAQETLKAAKKANNKAKILLANLNEAVKLAKNIEDTSAKIIDGVTRDYAQKNEALECTKKRLETLKNHLSSAKVELEKTKQAAAKAMQAAQETKSNVEKEKSKRMLYY